MKTLATFLFLLAPLLCVAQLRVSLGESKDSIDIPRVMINGELHPYTKGHALYSWRSKNFQSHILKLRDEFFIYYSENGIHYSAKISKFEISSCEIYAEGVSDAVGKISIRDECGVLFRFSLNKEIKNSSVSYRSYSDVIFKENVFQYFNHRYFKIQ